MRDLKADTRDLWASVLLFCMFAFQLTDWCETCYMLEFGGIEANPLMARIFAISPWLALAPKIMVVGFAVWVYLHMRHSKYALKLIAVPTVLSGVPVLWNAVQLYLAGLL